MKRLVVWTAAVAAVAFLSFVSARYVRSQSLTARTAFTVWQFEHAAAADPSRPSFDRFFFDAVSSDGSRAGGNYKPQPDGTIRVIARNVKSTSNRSQTLTLESAGAKSTTYFSPLQMLGISRRAVDRTCTNPAPGYHIAGQGNALGYEYVRWVAQGGSPTQRHEMWMAPALDCQQIGGVMEGFNPDGSLLFRTTQTPINITLGEPDPALFDTSRNTIEVKPSDLHSLVQQFEHPGAASSPSPDLRQKMDHLDQRYAASQPNKP